MRAPLSAEHRAKIGASNRGKTRVGGGRPKNSPASVWKRVARGVPDACWPWIGRTKSENGYGRMDVSGEEGVYAHRVAYLATHPGSIPLRAPADRDSPTCVLHRCDNPGCRNPAHLFLGTHADNMRDKSAKGRAPDFRGERGPRAKLTAREADEIRRVAYYGVSSGELARLFDVSKPTIKGVTSGRHYGAFK